MSSKATSTPHTFGTLNLWRKFFLGGIWFVNVVVAAVIALVFSANTNLYAQDPMTANVVLLAAMGCVAFTYWVHTAVAGRKLSQLKWQAFFSVMPFANPVLLLIMLSIIRVTKIECAAGAQGHGTAEG
jgi:hypothetical protein